MSEFHKDYGFDMMLPLHPSCFVRQCSLLGPFPAHVSWPTLFILVLLLIVNLRLFLTSSSSCRFLFFYIYDRSS